MTKQSKVKSVTGNGTFENSHGMFYKFEYTFEDGTVLTANHKTPNGNFNVGELVEYTVKGSNEYGSWGGVSKPKEVFTPSNSYSSTPSYGGSVNDSILFQVCLKGIMDFYVNNGSPAQWNVDSITQEAFEMAQKSKQLIEKL